MPMMGHLPSQRTTPAFPFQTLGVDFGGPFTILNRKGRGAKASKCYLCLFICFRYKCVHLEAVTELTKEAYIMTLRGSYSNSRPLCPISSSPNDYQSLTPGHFLIGRPLTSLAEPTLEMDNPSRLQRYARIELARQHFWKRWQNEYISELQHRSKWRTHGGEKLQVGDLVLLREENCPPLHWRMGRVKQLFPGVDGVSRVADITTQKGDVRRALTKLCPLLCQETL
ncbi:uncharacterized protein LOC128198961 [Bicyclus anynana]|uniref:Uncharacterized protein LOC128198961 n=1 Tax=Bicyclus anynana TaxID=110368 RepID=A0ABM3LV27_BICAN|nr:uncharacterized protein LOC128198961 [Bicyclus anynana]